MQSRESIAPALQAISGGRQGVGFCLFVFKEKVGLERKRTRISLCREISMGVTKGVRLREKVLGEIPVPPLSLTGYADICLYKQTYH